MWRDVEGSPTTSLSNTKKERFAGRLISSVNRGHLALSALHLHQAAEAAYRTILLVFIGYKPRPALARLLADHAARHASGIDEFIPRDGPNDEARLFKLLDHACIGARFDAKYAIAEDELERIAGRVRALIKQSRSFCAAELQRLEVLAGRAH